MTIEAGKRLGPYAVIAPIGAGGMGEVYKANDTRLDRIVAIKVLPEDLAESPERKARFEREAKAISQLNHPHICTLFDVGEQDGIDFIVMEYIEGETLADQLKKGALKLDQALEYGVQIADGLDTAHRAGIVHRDLKPANAMLTKSGIKLLDFGLARLVESDDASETSDAPTRQKDLTQEESIIGTLQYMAPEQLERKPADARTDIFSFGALLYEMVTGNKAFEGSSQASLISAIMTTEPLPIATLRPLTPARIDRIVGRCLAKGPDDRWQSARDIVLEISSLKDEDDAPLATTQPSRIGERLLWALALLLAVSVGVLLRGPGTPDTTKLSLSLPVGHQLMSGSGSVASLPAFDISPDGRNIVYAEGSEVASQLYLRSVGDFEAVAIPGTEGGFTPFFSADGQSVAYWARDSSLRTVAVAGGAPTKILDRSSIGGAGRGLSWASDGTIVIGGTQLYGVSEDGGVPEPIGKEESGGAFFWPQVLPGNKDVLVTLARRNEDRVVAVSLETGDVRTILEGYTSARYVSSGHLIVRDSGTSDLFSVNFDLQRLEVRGAPVLAVENVYMSSRSSIAQFAVSETGTLVYAPAEQGGHTLVWVDREGNASEAWKREGGEYAHPRVSPEGERLAVDYFVDGYLDIWVYELARGSRTRLTSSGAQNRVPQWMPDGKRVSFGSLQEGATGFYTRAADGSDEGDRFFAAQNPTPLSWSPDGSTLVYMERRGASNSDILTISKGGDPTVFLSSPFDAVAPSFSPDGRYIAYVSDESGRQEVYVRPYPAGDQKWTISAEGGGEPMWSRDGSELFFRNGNRMMLVDVRLTPEFQAGRPRLLFEEAYLVDPAHPAYDVAPDGRFLMIQDNNAERTQLNVVLNWHQELKALAPIDN